MQKQVFFIRDKCDEIICKICHPYKIGPSKGEIQLLSFIKSNYFGKIIPNSRSIIPPLELDIYLPDFKLAFEFNGVYWHSELYKPRNYHLNKTNECESKGIHLIHIYEDEWIYKKEIVKSRILNLFGNSKKIYGRKCILKEVTKDKIKIFLEENHIQGKSNSKINIGLYYKDQLVSLMTFGRSRFKSNSIEIHRFCNKKGFTVIGGASKLFTYFINKYPSSNIISYADRAWSMGNLYKQLGFKYVNNTKPNYHYIIDGVRFNRFKFRKSELIKWGFDYNKSEHDIMLERKIYRIYDSGSLKYKWNKI